MQNADIQDRAPTYNERMAAQAKKRLGERHCLHPQFHNPQAVAGGTNETILSHWLRKQQEERT